MMMFCKFICPTWRANDAREQKTITGGFLADRFFMYSTAWQDIISLDYDPCNQ